MSEGLQLISRHINQVLARQTRPLFVEIDDELRLLQVRGDSRPYGFDDLQPGTPMDQKPGSWLQPIRKTRHPRPGISSNCLDPASVIYTCCGC